MIKSVYLRTILTALVLVLALPAISHCDGCYWGICDSASYRDNFIPGVSTDVIGIRLAIHVFCDDNGDNCAVSLEDVLEQIDTLNSDYSPGKIQFQSPIVLFHSDSQYLNLESPTEVYSMKTTYAFEPDKYMNIYVVDTTAVNAVTPWGMNSEGNPCDPLGDSGGVKIDAAHFYPQEYHTLTHEIGHALGLWHTHTYVSGFETPPCNPCRELADGTNGDVAGDLCSDTPPTPENRTCDGYLDYIDPCCSTLWGQTMPENYMSYAPDTCRDTFTQQQYGRMHCWTNDALSSWIKDCDVSGDNILVDCNPAVQNEEQIAACLSDPDVLVAVWRDFRLGWRHCSIGRSTDGGETWSSNLVTELFPDTIGPDVQLTDPAVAAYGDSTFYVCFMSWSPPRNFLVFKSTDQGETWAGPTYVIDDPEIYDYDDKEFIAVDQNNGYLYIAWYRASGITFARSTDGGNSFGAEVTASTNSQGLGMPQPVVDDNGDVYVFFNAKDTIDEYHQAFVKSTDYGVNWSSVTYIYTHNNYPNAWIDGGIRIFGGPTAGADLSGGDYDGNLYDATIDWVKDSSETDIFCVSSDDGGASWSSGIRVNDDPLSAYTFQFLPSLTVSQNGAVAIVFYDQRVVDNEDFDLFAAYSFDGGETFTTNHRITDVSTSPDDLGDDSLAAKRLAEYIGVTADNNTIMAVWTDGRNGDQDVYFANYEIPFLEPRKYSPQYFEDTPDSLFWSTCWHEDSVYYLIQIDDNSSFQSIDVSCQTTDNKLYADSLTSLSDGVYYWRVKAYRNGGAEETEYGGPWLLEINDVILCGDANGSAQVDVADAVFLINNIYNGGPSPNPVCRGDANGGNGEVDVSDAVYLINYIYSGGPAPVDGCCD